MWVKLVNMYRQVRKTLGADVEPHIYDVGYIDVQRLEDVIEVLHDFRYFYNDLSTTARGQIYTARYLVDHDYQIHIRIYDDGRLTGHFETRTEHPSDHLIGVGYRPLNPMECKKLRIMVIDYLQG